MANPPSPDDLHLDALAKRARGGDHDAFRDLVLATQRALRSHLAARCLSFDLVEDVVQQTYIAAYHALPRYVGSGRMLAWLQTIGGNLLGKELRRRQREAVLDGDAIAQLWTGDGLDQLEALCSAEEQRRTLARLRHCLDQVGTRAATMLIRHHIERVPLRQLARHYQRAEATINKTLVRVRRALRACIQEGLRDG